MNVLDHYNDELRNLREVGTRFAKEHPQVAGQLGLHPDAVTDPFVERLLEGVAFCLRVCIRGWTTNAQSLRSKPCMAYRRCS